MSRPKCPNHTCEMSPTDNRRIWICPISGADFECDVDTQDKNIKLDKYGKPMASYKVTQVDGNGG